MSQILSVGDQNSCFSALSLQGSYFSSIILIYSPNGHWTLDTHTHALTHAHLFLTDITNIARAFTILISGSY